MTANTCSYTSTGGLETDVRNVFNFTYAERNIPQGTVNKGTNLIQNSVGRLPCMSFSISSSIKKHEQIVFELESQKILLWEFKTHS